MEKLKLILEGFPLLDDAYSSPKDQDVHFRKQADAVTKQLPETARALISAHPREALEHLSVSRNTISYAAVLDVVVKPSGIDAGPDRIWLQEKVAEFFGGFDPIQIRFVGDTLVRLLTRVAGNGLFTPQHTIQLLATAILRVDPSGSVFTSTHLLLANHALTLGIIELALPVLDKYITAYPSPTSLRGNRPLSDPELSPAYYVSTFTGLTEPVKAATVLDYGATLAQIYISRKEWSKARAALEQVITHPCKEKAVVKAMAAAHKRWLLVSLLDTGKAGTLPSYTPSNAKSYYKAQVAYTSIAEAFVASDPEQLQTEVNTHGITYEEDGNTGLVSQVLQAYQKWQVINLRMTYSRISISRIREETFSGETGQRLPSTEAMDSLLREMINSGTLKARFEVDEHGNETYLAFQDDTDHVSEEEFMREIARRQQSVEDLTIEYKQVNQRLTMNKEYAKFVAREQKRQPDEGTQPAGYDTSLEDEDLMSGILKAN